LGRRRRDDGGRAGESKAGQDSDGSPAAERVPCSSALLPDRGPDPSGTEAAEDDGRRNSVTAGNELPPALDVYLESCAKLAGEAIARGRFALAREIVDKAERVAALREVAA
jgi:hypothetical protein